MLKRDRSAGDEVHLKGIPDRGRVLLFAQSGGAKPIAATETDAGCLAAAWGGLEGFTPPHHYRRGQRLPTDTVPSPAPRVSAGLNFAVILLSKAMDVGRDHLIHRKRSPFPYEGKDLTRSKLRRDCKCRARFYIETGDQRPDNIIGA